MQQQDADLQVQQERLQMLRDIAQRFADLLKTGTVTEVAAKEKWAAVIEQQSRIATQQHARLQLQQQALDIQASLADLPLQTARETSRLSRELAELQQQRAENESRRRLVVRAEQSGTVVTLMAQSGQAVASGQPLAELLPSRSRLEAELLAPTRAIGLVRPGTEVLLRYDAFPYERFGQFKGRVRDISPTAVPSGALLETTRSPTPLYRIRVQLESQDVIAQGTRHRLRPGMQVSASLVLERRSLVEWVLEPLLGLTGGPG
ncbi:MAG: HlyD family efflux transporter periplasmic adaptor subunit [Pseudomonadota bacterium]